MERVDGSRAGSRLKGDAVEMICLRYNTYGICLPGHVTTRSRPTVPVRMVALRIGFLVFLPLINKLRLQIVPIELAENLPEL